MAYRDPLIMRQHGNNREAIFCAAADYRFHFEKPYVPTTKHRCEIHAYVLMTNHVHPLANPADRERDRQAHATAGTLLLQYHNFCYQQRTDTLWEGRYKATLIDTDHYLLTRMRYIELNPVRSAMVWHPSEYPWPSYRHTARGQTDELLSTPDEYRKAGC